MKPFRVTLERRTAFEAAIEVEAESAEEAERLARERAGDGMVAWTEVHAETTVEASE